MNIKITHLLDHNLTDYSASAMELGDRAGSITWNNALNSGLCFFTNEIERNDLCDYIETFGAWSIAEIWSWADKELNALVLQLIAGDLREYLSAKEKPDFARWQENHGGRIYAGDDNQFYYYIGI